MMINDFIGILLYISIPCMIIIIYRQLKYGTPWGLKEK